MPSPRVLNLNPPPRTEYTPLEQTLSSFSNRNRENELNQRETDALRDIYSQYQNDGQNIENAIMAVQSRPDISPTSRVNTVNQLLQVQKYNHQLQKDSEKKLLLNQRIADTENRARLEKEEKESERTRAREALELSNATEEQKALYEASPVGGQTKIVEDILDSNNRRKAPPGLISKEFEDYDTGLTPKERVKRQESRFTVQTPLVVKNSLDINSLESEKLSLDLLEELNNSGAVGQGLNNLNINPSTGSLFIPKKATPEEQLFVKTVNDFTVKAKDSFGARVTNFELDRFMQRLPTLANSEDGRRLIMTQMKIVNQINGLEKKALQNVFDQYGVRNIDYVDAENIARNQIKDQKESLRKEYFKLEQLAKKEDQELVKNVKENLIPGYTAMRKPDGTIKQFPDKNVPNLEEKGYKKL